MLRVMASPALLSLTLKAVMLDLQKLMGQMQGMSEQLHREAQQLTVKLDRAETIFHQAIVNQASLNLQSEQYRDRLIFNCAEPVEALSQI